MKKTGINIQQTCWKDIREEFSRVNNPLTEIIDALDPNKDFTLFIASDPFGEIPLHDGCFQLPDQEGNNQKLSHTNISRTIQNELSYNQGAMPVSMVMDNSFEVFLQFNHYTLLPHGLLTKGDVFSTWRVLSNKPHQVPKFTWNVSSGARSIFMLPKIAEKKRHARLKKTFGIQSDTPSQLLDHWKIFKELANSHTFEAPWAGKLIFFGKKWFESLNDSAWIFFKQFLLQSAWDKTAFGRNQFVWDLVYSLIQAKIHLKPDPYIMDTVKYLLSIAAGSMPGFFPVIDDHAGPMKQLKKIYLEQYQIEYAPIIMHPQFFQTKKSVYYSLEVTARSPLRLKIPIKCQINSYQWINPFVFHCLQIT